MANSVAKKTFTARISVTEVPGYWFILASNWIIANSTSAMAAVNITRSMPFVVKREINVPMITIATIPAYIRLAAFGPEPISPTARFTHINRNVAPIAIAKATREIIVDVDLVSNT